VAVTLDGMWKLEAVCYFSFILWLADDGLSREIDCSDFCGAESCPCLCYDSTHFSEVRCYEKNITKTTSFPYNSRFKSFNFKGNFLTEIKTEAFYENGYSQANRMYLSDNRIYKLEPEAFKGLYNLEELHLKNNLVHHLHKDTFKGLKKLHTLNFNNNKLQTLDLRVLAPFLSTLKKLYLRGNHLRQVRNEHVFAQMKQLRTLDLSDNRILQLDGNPLAGLPRLQTVFVANNRFSCGITDLCLLDPLLRKEWRVVGLDRGITFDEPKCTDRHRKQHPIQSQHKKQVLDRGVRCEPPRTPPLLDFAVETTAVERRQVEEVTGIPVSQMDYVNQEYKGSSSTRHFSSRSLAALTILSFVFNL